VSAQGDQFDCAIRHVARCGARFSFAFKHIHPSHLASLNSGRLGKTQIGKAITIYPNCDDDVPNILADLTRKLRGMIGPVIRHEIRPTSLAPIYLRYGSFVGSGERTLLGLRSSTVSTLEGQVVEDNRSGISHLTLARPAIVDGTIFYISSSLFDARFKIIRSLSDKGYCASLLAFDTQSSRLCTLRIAIKHACGDSLDRDAADRARMEADLLGLVQDRGIAPGLIGLWDLGDAVVVCREWLPGETLMKRLTGSIPQQLRQSIKGQLHAMVRIFEELGYYIADLSPANLVIDDDDRLSIIDLESCIPVSSPHSARFGTFGYTHPRYLGGEVGPDTDAYSIDAIMTAIERGSDLSRFADPDRLVQQSRYIIDADLTLHRTGGLQNAEMADASYSDGNCKGLDGVDLKSLVYALIASILETGDFSGARPPWSSTSPGTAGMRTEDIHSGTAGICYGLLRAAWAFQDEDLVELVESLSVEAFARLSDEKLSGLFVGRSGLGWLFLALFRVTGKQEYLDKALRIGATLQAPVSPDLLHGRAGMLLYLVWLYRATGSSEIQTSALDLAQQIAAEGVDVDGVPLWVIGPGYGSLSDYAWLGLAHGTAGIVYALMEAAHTFKRPQLSVVCSAYFNNIAVHARPKGPHQSDLPDQPTGSLRSGVWCHGGGGHAIVLLRAQELGYSVVGLDALIAGSLEMAPRTGPSLCHGLSSALELGMCADSDRVLHLAGDLVNLHVRVDGTRVSVPDNEARTATLDFLCGAAGVVSTLARVAAPGRLGNFFGDPVDSFKTGEREACSESY
jgi:serine/threonine protein kinase